MFDDFLNHRCNIYHLVDDPVNVGYGIRTADTRTDGEEVLEDIPCHFSVRQNDQLKVVQNEPYSSIDGDIKLTLPIGTDIRLNDTVEDCETLLRYRAGIPRKIHGNHHIIVTIRREEGEPNAI